jgi:putative flippase GtrA
MGALKALLRHFSPKQQQILLFVIAGGLGAVFEIAVFYVLHRAGINVLLASVLSTVLAISLNYLLSIAFVFERGRHSTRAELAAFAAVSTGVIIVNQMVFTALLWLFPSYATVCKAAAILLVATLSYVAKKRWVFAG